MMGSLSSQEIEELLHGEVIARLGCHAEGRTYVVPITYAYDNNSLIVHSAEGLKMRMMRENPWVCVEVDRMDDLANWRSSDRKGRFEERRG
jgi:nitroimidazol reductase NimA-like FMN-containing flavoprotein (pyridoxamine 5'-phosphate oxidase superfamily)